MRNSVMIGCLALSVFFLASVPFVSAEAAGTYLAASRMAPLRSDAIEVKSHKSGSSPKFSPTKFRSSPKFTSQKSGSSPKFSSQKYKVGPQFASKKSKPGPEFARKKYKAPFASKKYEATPKYAKKWVTPKQPAKKSWFAKRVRKGIRWVGSHRYYGAYFIVPFGTSLYARHYCYDWFYGPYGWGYYWNYDRCPIPPRWLY